jgi:DNA polymerase-3 subunit delta'
VGKQRLALWLGQLLLCQYGDPGERPCGRCEACRFTLELAHPDLRWFFPRPRLSSTDASADEVMDDYADAISERLRDGGLYAPPSGTEAIYVASVRALVHLASYKPAMGARKIFVAGDAERMVPQEGADQAANAFLKLLEEPPADTTIMLTSSEPGALLPTIRSRVVSVRMAPLLPDEMRAFLAEPAVASRLDVQSGHRGDELIRLAAGAPGRLIGREAWEVALNQARRVLDAVDAPDRGTRFRVALSQGGMGARGKFSDMLDALTVLLNERARSAASRGNDRIASGAARGAEYVEEAKEMAYGNVNPQLVAASLLDRLAALMS